MKTNDASMTSLRSPNVSTFSRSIDKSEVVDRALYFLCTALEEAAEAKVLAELRSAAYAFAAAQGSPFPGQLEKATDGLHKAALAWSAFVAVGRGREAVTVVSGCR